MSPMADTDEDIYKTESLPKDVKRKRNIEDLQNINTNEYIESSQFFQETIIHYDTENYISRPKRAKDGTVPIDILELHHSFSYDCRRYFNICVADPETIIFVSGNLIHFFNVVEHKIWFRRCSTGGGIGHITKNPKLNHFAVGENGNNPPIIIYEWPSLDIVTVLWHGTTRSFSHLAYSPDGQLLVSQGGDPDCSITIWNWQQSKIIVRCKSPEQDILNVMFSPSVYGNLSSSGLGHIKFWKMASTFTGLKLNGELGRFEKTEICDILGVYPMPDEKVVSSCEWGNILIWDEGLIKFEVCRNNKEPCHSNFTTQFEFYNGELISIGMDGWIRIWFYDSIDQADPSDDDGFFEIEPIYEFCISERDIDDLEKNAMLMCIQKKEPANLKSTLWYAQDANGGLWIIDLCTCQTLNPSRKLLICHAGPITDIAVADWGPFVATCGKDNYLHVYNYCEKKLILVHKFSDIGSKILWLPCAIESTGSTIVCAFETGIIRMVTTAILNANASNDVKGQYVKLLQVIKPHTKKITTISLNPSNILLLTGSEDSTIFVFFVEKTKTYPSLFPIGFVKTPSGITCLMWKPEFSTTVLLGCSEGECIEITIPNKIKSGTFVTYELTDCKHIMFKFQSVKSEIQSELILKENEKCRELRLAEKQSQMEALKLNNSLKEIDQDSFIMDSQEHEPLPEIYKRKEANPVLALYYTLTGTICLTIGGFDAGYLYEYPKMESIKTIDSKPIRSTMIYEADNMEIRSFLFYNKHKYVFLGMEHGEIRVCRINPDDHMDLSDYWELPMHDNFNGYIPKMLLSHDHKMLLTCGHDGNLFSFYINDGSSYLAHVVPIPECQLTLPTSDVEDIEEYNHPSLEEVLVQKIYTEMSLKAQENKRNTLYLLQVCTQDFSKIIEENSSLLKSQQISKVDLELDPRIKDDLNNQLKAELDFVHRQIVFKVEKSKLRLKKLNNHLIEPITFLPFRVYRTHQPNTKVRSFREQKLGNEFVSGNAEVTCRLAEKNKLERSIDSKGFESLIEDDNKEVLHGIESFLKGLSRLSPYAEQYKLGVEANQMLRRYRARRAKLEVQQKERNGIFTRKFDQNDNRPDDHNEIKPTKVTTGNWKLKRSTEFNKIKYNLNTVLSKYKQLLACDKKAHYLREDFNTKLKEVRTKKLSLGRGIQIFADKLSKIQPEIPEKKIKPPFSILTFNYDVEYPENYLEVEKYKSISKKVEEGKRNRKSVYDILITNDSDQQYENFSMLLRNNKMIQSQSDVRDLLISPIFPKKHYIVQTTVPSDILQALYVSDDNETAWEREIKRVRILNINFEQNYICNQIEQDYQYLDSELDILEKERLEIIVETLYLDLLLLTLNQELIISRKFEVMEDSLSDRVNKKIKEHATARKKIHSINNKIQNANGKILKLQKEIKALLLQYTNLVNDNNFYSFLLRIFNKKYKQSQEANEFPSSSSSLTSESISDEDDAVTIDSRELGLLRIEENVVPIGCDKELYNMAFALREKKQKYESLIKQEQTNIEGLRKDREMENKKLKVVQHDLKSNQRDLNAFMQKKQEKLNGTDIAVVLKFDQLQYILSNSKNVENIRECNLFNKEKLSQLYARVGELQQETSSQLSSHKKSRTHLYRFKVDYKNMKTEMTQLKASIKYEMNNKFGQEISDVTFYLQQRSAGKVQNRLPFA
ncbi:cilia- and flagella-associated protein 44 isoform X2 [Belonocnema kinseyi]|uniref:cilia- and flagella-associated protein 44 isoform X2 n=1 Tax=Belonocnema kinseyi TaxID=2817044 RepID=UPI00143D4F5F|nr:cilia- and flagella-associated protein 44 isoform X2 [Belonocnema kinseyi]